MNSRSLLLLTLLDQSSPLIWVEILTTIIEIASVVKISMPKTVIYWSFEHILFDQLAQQFFDASDVSECGISHQPKQMLHFILYWDVHAEV